MLNVPVPPATAPTWLSCGVLLGVVSVSTGASSSSPKLNVPLLTAKTQGTVIGVDESLSASVQLAAPLFRATTLVPPGLAVLFNKFFSVPMPASVNVVEPG